MDRPPWTSAIAWQRLEPALRAQAEHAADALIDLGAMTARWDAARRDRLLMRVADLALAGLPLPAALITALTELLGD